MTSTSGHGCAGGSGRAWTEGLAEIETGRRTLLTAGAAGGAGLAFSVASGLGGAAEGAAPPRRFRRRRAYVLVVDGCLPGEIDGGLTPNLKALRDGGLRWPRASALPVMETLPNHVMMMTGVRPDRNGVPANKVYDRREREVRDLDRPRDIKVPTVIDRLNRRGFRTGTVLSKEYLYGIFGGRATHRWEPAPIIPVSGHAPDVFTMRATTEMVRRFDPHLVFVNLGDIDRFGHTDLTGQTVQVLRRLALAGTDRLVGQFVQLLKRTGRWDDSVVIVLADHSMDWSRPDRVISLQGTMDADPLLGGKVAIAGNGGADLLYWTGPAAQRQQAVTRMRALAARHPGVLQTHDPRRSTRLRLGPEVGDVPVYCRAGWRFSDPDPLTSNPIPGNHGHPATRAIPFFIGGGHPLVRDARRRSSPSRASTVDVAPTLASFFGLRKAAPKGGYDGRARL